MYQFVTFQAKNIQGVDESDLTSLLIQIASSKETTIYHLDIETASDILSHILQKTYSVGIPYEKLLEETQSQKYITHYGAKIFLADKQLFLVILLNSIRKHHESIKTKTEISENIIKEIVQCLDVKKRHTQLLLRTLYYILIRKENVSPLLAKQIIVTMRKVALSPLYGFKQYAHDISKTTIPFLNDSTKEHLCNIDLIPIRGINTLDLVKLFSENFMRNNISIVVKRICFLFQNNLDNKDGNFLYERLIQYYPFEKWKEEIWPLFLCYLQNINDSG